MRNMKKVIALALSSILVFSLLGGCKQSGKDSNGEKTAIAVGASITPHAEILREAAKIMEEKGYTRTVQSLTTMSFPILPLKTASWMQTTSSTSLICKISTRKREHILSQLPLFTMSPLAYMPAKQNLLRI